MLSCFKLKGAAVRIAQSTRPTLLYYFTIRRYASAIDAISLKRQQEIAAAIRAYQKDNITVPWLDMVRQYRILQAAMEQALVADDARRENRMKLSIRVTKLANLAYNEQSGRCDWPSVARDMDMPLIECLRLFDASLSTVLVRSLPNITDWSAGDLSTLKSLVLEQFGAVTVDEWRLISVYMNVEQNDCFMAHTMCTFPQMTPDLHEAITQLRINGLQWKDIFEKHPLFSCISGLCNAYYEFKEPGDSKLKTIYSEWTDADTCRIQELVQTYYKPGNQRDVLIQAQIAFPNRSQQSIINKVKWILRKWNADDVARLVHLVSTYKGRKIDWAAIGKDLGRTASSCQNKHGEFHRNHINPTIDHSEAVSHEVQKQYEQQHCVDWTGIAHLLGLTERECLEANQFNTGKARWIYHPDTFSWDMANRMKTFIKDNYPEPLPVNYTAVSNYMWIVMSDCVKMASLLRGEMVWTAETIAKVVKLRKNGMVYKDIARQLSPVLNKSKIVGAYYGHIKSKVNAPLTCKEKHRIKEMMNTHAEQMPFTELRALVVQKMTLVNQQALGSFINTYAASLPVYKERLCNVDTDQIASQVLNGTNPSKLAAQLDIPPLMLTRLMRKNAFSIHSLTWSTQETEKLLKLVRTNTRPYNWKSVSEVIGTKSPKQCYIKYVLLKQA